MIGSACFFSIGEVMVNDVDTADVYGITAYNMSGGNDSPSQSPVGNGLAGSLVLLVDFDVQILHLHVIGF